MRRRKIIDRNGRPNACRRSGQVLRSRQTRRRLRDTADSNYTRSDIPPKLRKVGVVRCDATYRMKLPSCLDHVTGQQQQIVWKFSSAERKSGLAVSKYRVLEAISVGAPRQRVCQWAFQEWKAHYTALAECSSGVGAIETEKPRKTFHLLHSTKARCGRLDRRVAGCEKRVTEEVTLVLALTLALRGSVCGP